MHHAMGFIVASILAALTLIVTSTGATAQPSRQQEAYATAVDAYIYFYPLVTMDVTRLQLTNVPADKAKGPQGPMNEFQHLRSWTYEEQQEKHRCDNRYSFL